MSNPFKGQLILRDKFNLTILEIEDGHFLDKIRKDDKYLQKLLKYNHYELLSIIYWCRDKFTQYEVKILFKNVFPDEFINNNLI